MCTTVRTPDCRVSVRCRPCEPMPVNAMSSTAGTNRVAGSPLRVPVPPAKLQPARPRHRVLPRPRLLEALSAGVAVVATTAGGIGTVVDHERTGLVVPERRADAIAEAVQRLALNPALRSSLGQAARHMVESRFGWGHTAERFEAAYRRAVANKAGGR